MRSSRARCWPRLGPAVLAAAMILGCGGPGATDLAPIPELGHPEALYPAVYEQYRTLKAALEEELARRPRDVATLARAFGEMGMWFETYDDLQAAEPCYRNARILEPAATDWIAHHGRVLAALNTPEEARKALLEVLAREPGDPVALFRLAKLEEDTGRLESARERNQALLEIPDFRFQGHLALGRIALRDGDLVEAAKHLQAVVDEHPEVSEAHHLLGQALVRQGRRDAAAEHLRRAATASRPLPIEDPLQQQVAGMNLGLRSAMRKGRRALQQRRFEASAEAFRQALEVDPEHAPAHLNLGRTLLALGETDAGEASVHRSLELDPGQPRAYQLLAQAKLQAGDPAAARAHLQHALELDPAFAEGLRMLASLAVRDERYAEAEGLYRRWSESEPGNARARARHILSLGYLERWQDAAALLLATGEPPTAGPLARLAVRLAAAAPQAELRDGARAVRLAGLDSGAASRDLFAVEGAAMALAEAGRFDQATRLQVRALAAMAATAPERVRSRARERLETYRRGQPWRRPWEIGEAPWLGVNAPGPAPASDPAAPSS